MEYVLFGVLGLGLSIAAPVLRGFVRRRVAARADRAVRGGAVRSIPILVRRKRMTYGRAVRDGSDFVVFAGLRRYYLVDARQFRDAAKRIVVDDENERSGGLRTLRDESGDQVSIGPSAEYEPVLRALSEAPSHRLSGGRRLAAAIPRAMLALVLLAAVPLVSAQVVWWTGHDVQATVVKVIPYVESSSDDEVGDLCMVRWVEDGAPQSSGVTCYEPYPAVGSRLKVRALAGPWQGSAMDYVESYALWTGIFGAVTAVLVVIGIGWGQLRVTATPRRLTTTQRQRSGPLPTPATSALGATPSDFVDVAVACARAEGWADDPPVSPSPPSRSRQVFYALSDPWWYAVLIGGGAGLAFLEGDTTLYAAAGLVLVGTLAVVCLLRSLRAWRMIRSAYEQPFAHELRYVVARTVEDEWTVFLLQDGRPRWAVDFTRGQHPPVTGTATVRGDLEGGAVHLRIDGELWVPDGPATPLEDDDVTEVRDALRETLDDARD